MSVVSAAGGPTDAAPVDRVRLIEQRARDLLKAEDVPAARQVTEEGLRTSPNLPVLLWLLADVEFADGDQQAALCCLAKAVEARGGDAEAISKQIRALSENRLWRETLMTVEHVPAQVRDDPCVRTAVGDFYKTLGCHGHAVGGYGDSSGLSSSTRRKRRRSWLRSGGPFTFVRGRVDAWEDSQLLSKLRRGERTTAQLDAVPGLDSRQAHRLKVRVENGNFEWSYHYELWAAVFRWLLRLLPVAFLPVWLVLYAIVNAADFISGPPGMVAGTAISAVVALGLAVLVLRSLVRSDLTLRGSLRRTPALGAFLFAIAVLSEIAVAEGYIHNSLPTAGWWAWVVFGLVVLPAIGACMLVSAAILTVLAGWRLNGVTRKYCDVALLDILLGMLLDMQSPSRQLDLQQRLDWSRQLEWCAKLTARDLLPSQVINYLASADWFKQRAAGWAEALRQMQREMVAPARGARPKLEARLRHEIWCLATGNLGTLAWRKPPPRPSQRHQAISAFRTMLEAVLPLVLVLAAQPIVHGILHRTPWLWYWFLIGTIAWALFIVLQWLDPAIRDKFDTVGSLADTFNAARRGRLPIRRPVNVCPGARRPQSPEHQHRPQAWPGTSARPRSAPSS